MSRKKNIFLLEFEKYNARDTINRTTTTVIVTYFVFLVNSQFAKLENFGTLPFFLWKKPLLSRVIHVSRQENKDIIFACL